VPVEAVMLWNEPNNLSHWDFEVDREWRVFSTMARLAGQAVRAESRVTRVLGGISPIDPAFITRMEEQGGLDEVDVVAVHGFPLDWNHWQLDEWPEKLAEIRAVTSLPVWISEVGVSTFGAEEVQEFGLRRTAELLLAADVPRIHWYSLFDLPRAWPATTRHREAEGSSYYRHFYMGLLREDGSPKKALRHLVDYTPELGVCQWFHFEDHRLDDAVSWLKKLGVKRLRTGLSWADSLRPGAEAWFDRQMQALEPFDVTLTYCYTPESRGVKPNHTSPPQVPQEFADFCAAMTRRYAK
jgi:beta-xylosidase